ncbi:hypothetical protein AB6J89_004694 [Salmonella enterica]
MLLFRAVVALIMVIVAFAVIYNLPYPYLSPRWFFTAAGVAFLTAAFVGFILPDNKKGGGSC